MPWESIIKESTNIVEYWMREMQEPTLANQERSEVAPSWVKQQQAEDRGIKRIWVQRDKGSAKGQHGKRNIIWHTANRQGVELCRNYGNDTFKRGAECSWAHQCEMCLAEHAMQECTRNPEKGKGGKKGKAGKKKGRGKGQ